MVNKATILRRILFRIIQDRLAIAAAKIHAPKVVRALHDAENDIYEIA